MKCPHCLVEIHRQMHAQDLRRDNQWQWQVVFQICPACERIIVELAAFGEGMRHPTQRWVVYPRTVSRTPPAPEVPNDFAQDYREACLVLSDSPKASAALGRRCLQHVLREKAKVKPGNLADEIQQVLDSGKLPSDLADAIDAVRHLGNFAAHPTKNTNTGEIVDVESEEAEWLLDTLEGLFDFYFVRPAKMQEKRDKLNKKLTDAGKPEMK